MIDPFESKARMRRRIRELNIATTLVNEGASLRLVARLFGVSPSTVHVVKRQFFPDGIIPKARELPP